MKEAVTIAVTGSRRTGKTTTLTLFGLIGKQSNYEIWCDFNLKFANRHFTSLTEIQEVTKPTIILSDEAHRIADARMSMLNIPDTYALILQGHYPNTIVFMALPFHLSDIALVDIRIRYLFDYEIRPLIKDNTLFLRYYTLRAGKYLNDKPIIKAVRNIQSLWQYFDTHEKFIFQTKGKKPIITSKHIPLSKWVDK
jgi:hypothetical protein